MELQGCGEPPHGEPCKFLLNSRKVDAICFMETKTKNVTKITHMGMKLGFTRSFMVYPLGFAGGLLLLWNPDTIDLDIVGHASQVIHGIAKGLGGKVTRISFAYVRPNPRAKDIFWSDCRAYANQMEDPWIIIGDFNDIASDDDQWGSERINCNVIDKFVENFNNCGLMDLESSGPRYSWVRQVGNRTVQRRKLDRVLWNMRAQLDFLEAKMFILPRVHSDHHPISFVGEAGEVLARHNRPFRFEVAWLMRHDYQKVWETAWNKHKEDPAKAIEEVINKSKIWNQKVFGNIF